MREPFAALPEAARDKLQRRGMAGWTAPMLATLTDDRFSSEGWIYERKLDGERCLVFRGGRRLGILSRDRNKLNDTCPELVERFEDAGPERFIAGDDTLEHLLRRRQQIERDEPAFAEAAHEHGAHRVKPELVAEFGFGQWRSDGKLRHPRNVGLREDRPAKRVRRERPRSG